MGKGFSKALEFKKKNNEEYNSQGISERKNDSGKKTGIELRSAVLFFFLEASID
jgi:hypothetical protein